jgi:hypothetical protein
MIVLGAFVLASIGRVRPSKVSLREGLNRVFSLTDTISMGFVLMGSTGLLIAPIVWAVVQPRWISLPVIVAVVLVALHIRYMRPLRGLQPVENAILVGLPIIVFLDIVLGMPSPLRSTALLMTIASALSMFVVVTADVDDKRSKYYRHENVMFVVHLARWGLRAIPVYGIYHVAMLSRGWIDNVTKVLVVVAGVLVALAVTCLTLALFNWKGISFSRKER